ncbi:MAG: sigma-54-dependent Fis family transcriptional regulator [Nitrospinae bacterium]|nr:sigma-54-dependent Fis family transcriptional regulator [Nitrospinota bacterium]
MTVEPKKILVVDDEESMRIALSEALSRSGHAVITAADGLEGARRFEEEAPGLVIADVRMPRLSGLELLKRVREKSPGAPFVLITAYGSVDDAVEAMKMGATDYLLKPFSADTLDQLLNRVFENGAPSPAAPARKPAPERAAPTREIVTGDESMRRVLAVALKVARSKSTVLIHGESGTGKELVARYLHESSDRRDGPFVAVNCAALPETLLESELFGHEKGSFTGAIARKAGKFELAHKGTILLDEVTEMTPQLQAKLLRVLQEEEIDRVGGAAPVPIDIRVVATTNRDIQQPVAEGKFREDLYFRLNVIPLRLPPLRERSGDVLLLARHFVAKFAAALGKKVEGFTPEAGAAVVSNPWKGNVRELENVIERATLLCSGELIDVEDLMLAPSPAAPARPAAGEAVAPGVTVAEMERRLIFTTLDATGGNRTRAAEMLGLSIRTLRNKLHEYRATHGLPPGGEEE